MSIQALTWAFSQEIRPGNVKFVLVALCDFANENWEAYPSVQTLCRKTCLNRKTVQQALSTLSDAGYLVDTGERKGSTRMVKVYRIETSPRTGQLDFEQTDPSLPPNEPKDGPVKQAQRRAIEPSVPNRKETETADADGEPSPKEIIWNYGVQLLTKQGSSESHARSFLGKWARDNEKRLAAVLGTCMVRQPVNAKEYIARAMKGGAKPSSPEQAKRIAEEEGVPIKKGDTFEMLVDRIYEYRREREHDKKPEIAGSATGA